MNPYVIFTDSGSDVALELLAEWGVRSQSLSFRFDGSEKEYVSGDMPEKENAEMASVALIAKSVTPAPVRSPRKSLLPLVSGV